MKGCMVVDTQLLRAEQLSPRVQSNCIDQVYIILQKIIRGNYLGLAVKDW